MASKFGCIWCWPPIPKLGHTKEKLLSHPHHVEQASTSRFLSFPSKSNRQYAANSSHEKKLPKDAFQDTQNILLIKPDPTDYRVKQVEEKGASWSLVNSIHWQRNPRMNFNFNGLNEN